MVDKDRSWKEHQAQWGMNGFSIAQSLILLEAAITAALMSVDGRPSRMTETLLSLKEELNEQVATPMAHTL